MAWQFSVYLLPTFLGGVLAAALAVFAWRRRERRAALPFAIYLVGIAIWSFAYGIELGFTRIGPTLAWDSISFVGSVIVPTAWLVMTLEYAGYDRWLTRKTVTLLAVEPIATLGLVLTNQYHHLIWAEASMQTAGPLLTPQLTFGPAYWANLGYSYLLVVLGVAVLLRVLLVAGRPYRRQTALLLAGTLVPFLANASFNLLETPTPIRHLDLTSFAFAIAGVFYAVALFRLGLFELVPIARERLFDVMEDGIVVLDGDGEIADANPAAHDALGEDVEGDSLEATPLGTGDGLVTLDVEEETHTYEVTRTGITDFRNDAVGSLVLMRDITRLSVLRDHEQRLSVLNRVLRHNLRNDLNVVTGLSGNLASDLDGEAAETARTIRRTATKVLETSENARHVQATIGTTSANAEAVDVSSVVRDVADEVAAKAPEARIDVTAPEGTWASVVGRDQLRAAVWNLGENAIEHADDDSPQVQFDVTVREEVVSVSVTDDGPGIPANERAAILSDRESDLVHGSGLGLWLVRWVAEASDGELSFAANDPTGTTVTIELPAGTPPNAGMDET